MTTGDDNSAGDNTSQPVPQTQNSSSLWDKTAHVFKKHPVSTIGGFALALLPFLIPLAVFSIWGNTKNWMGFWEYAATPYGTMVAGYAAITAAGIALFNGQQQRIQEARIQNRQMKAQKDALRAQTEQAKTEKTHRDELYEEEKNRNNAQQSHNEKLLDAELVRDLRTRFTTAVQQLSHTSETIQQGGVYSLAALANDWLSRKNDTEAQVCIDVLCSYLRTHHHIIAKQDNLNFTADFDYSALSDMTVRETIMHVFQQHLKSTNNVHRDPGAWSHLKFNFTRAPLPDVNFDNAVFSSRVGFGGARFTEGGNFNIARFTDGADFGAAQFNSDVSFYNATFSQHAIFSGTQFYSRSSFSKATFIGIADFADAVFCDITDFLWATFEGYADLRYATFKDYADFRLAAFTAGMSIDGVIIDGSLTHDASNAVDFSSPRAWFRVSCKWEKNIENKPKRVRPDQWPPILATPETENAISSEIVNKVLNLDGDKL